MLQYTPKICDALAFMYCGKAFQILGSSVEVFISKSGKIMHLY